MTSGPADITRHESGDRTMIMTPIHITRAVVVVLERRV